jgi:tRNA(fMet)-specific endonuclease VapC
MLKYLFDTDHFTLWDQGDLNVIQRLAKKPGGSIGLSVVTVEEIVRERLAYLSRARDAVGRLQGYHWLMHSLQILQCWIVVPYESNAEKAYQHLLGQRVHIGSQDLKIASIALANQLIVVTRNQRDFGRVPGLVIEDWSL